MKNAQLKPTVAIVIPDNNPLLPGERPIEFLKTETQKKISEAKLDSVFITNQMSIEQQDEVLARASGIVLIGGIDINPKRYGQEPSQTLMCIDDKRDDVDIRMAKEGLSQGIPTIGICRGAQVMTVACGGELIQHLPDNERFSKEKHGVSIEVIDDYPSSVFHDILIKPGTKAAEIFPADRVNVPSRHHQAIEPNNPGTDIIVSGSSPDGVVEVIEHKKHPFYVGVQTHPELVNDMNYIFEAFAKEVYAYSAQKRLHNNRPVVYAKDSYEFQSALPAQPSDN